LREQVYAKKLKKEAPKKRPTEKPKRTPANQTPVKAKKEEPRVLYPTPASQRPVTLSVREAEPARLESQVPEPVSTTASMTKGKSTEQASDLELAKKRLQNDIELGLCKKIPVRRIKIEGGCSMGENGFRWEQKGGERRRMENREGKGGRDMEGRDTRGKQE
jgi:hypothetical protein